MSHTVYQREQLALQQGPGWGQRQRPRLLSHPPRALDAEPVQVYAHAQPGFEVDDGAHLLLVFPGDRVAQISVGFNAWPLQYIEISGSEAMLRIDKPWNNNDLPTTIKVQSQRGTEWIAFEPTFQYTHQLRHLCHCLDTGQPHRISPQDSISQMRVLDAVQESMETGGTARPM